MLYKNTESTTAPCAVLMEHLPDGTARVCLCDNIRQETREEQPVYIYDEAVFLLDADRKETAADIEANFSAWWAYGIEPEEPAPTMEERVSLIEETLLELFGGE